MSSDFEVFPELKSERLLLRQILEDDAGKIFEGLSHPEVIKYYGVNFQTLEQTLEQMKWYQNIEEQNTGIWWAVCSEDNQEFYGAGGFNNYSSNHQKAEIGFWLLPKFWGNGLLQEAMPLIINYGFSEMKLNRIEGFVETGNFNCKKAISKLKFIYEGTMKDCEVKNGKFISLEIYALFNE